MQCVGRSERCSVWAGVRDAVVCGVLWRGVENWEEASAGNDTSSRQS